MATGELEGLKRQENQTTYLTVLTFFSSQPPPSLSLSDNLPISLIGWRRRHNGPYAVC